MTLYIALFRGINVGGRQIVPMRELRRLLGSLGCENVRTYIQSGNAPFESTETQQAPSRKIARAMDSEFDFRPGVMVLSADVLLTLARRNPYRDAIDDPRHLHIWVLAESPVDPDLDKLETLRTDSERFVLDGNALYLHAPDGIGRSNLAAAVETCLGVATTPRNWRTTKKLMNMVAETRIA